MKDKYKIQVGDVMYEIANNKAIAWEITDIFLESYVNGWKTVCRIVKPGHKIYYERFATEVCNWCRSEEEANEIIAGRKE